MTLLLISHLKTETNIEYYPLIMPTNCIKPACVYTLINNKDNQSLNGCVASETQTFQIDLYTKHYNDKLATIKAALYSFKAYPTNLNVVDTYETDTELFRKIITFTLRK